MNHCKDQTTCPDGNCIGCKDGEIWCYDPRCQPNCPSCSVTKDHDFIANLVFIITLICLVTLLFVVWFAYGPQLIFQEDKLTEEYAVESETVTEKYIEAVNPQSLGYQT